MKQKAKLWIWIVFSLVILGFAVFVYYAQQGVIKISADVVTNVAYDSAGELSGIRYPGSDPVLNRCMSINSGDDGKGYVFFDAGLSNSTGIPCSHPDNPNMALAGGVYTTSAIPAGGFEGKLTSVSYNIRGSAPAARWSLAVSSPGIGMVPKTYPVESTINNAVNLANNPYFKDQDGWYLLAGNDISSDPNQFAQFTPIGSVENVLSHIGNGPVYIRFVSYGLNTVYLDSLSLGFTTPGGTSGGSGGGVSPAPTSTSAGSVFNLYGFHDSSSGLVTDVTRCKAAGWAIDDDQKDQSINVYVYLDKTAQQARSENFVGIENYARNIEANISRPDVCRPVAEGGIGSKYYTDDKTGECNHGFSLNLASSFPQMSDGQEHTVYVYPGDAETRHGDGSLLQTSPKKITCEITKPIVPVITATPVDSDSIKLTWTNTDPSATSFRVYNQDGVELTNGVWDAPEAPTPDNNHGVTFNGLNCNSPYSFYIRSVNDAGVLSDNSNTATATTLACGINDPDISGLTPTNVRLEITGQTTATLSWDAVAGATGYDIFNCSGTLIHSVSETSYDLTGLSCGTEYCFYVVAHNDTYRSQNSEQVTGTTNSCSVVVPVTNDGTGIGVGTLISTGSNLWINILIAVLFILGVGYFMFRDSLFHKTVDPTQTPPQS